MQKRLSLPSSFLTLSPIRPLCYLPKATKVAGWCFFVMHLLKQHWQLLKLRPIALLIWHDSRRSYHFYAHCLQRFRYYPIVLLLGSTLVLMPTSHAKTTAVQPVTTPKSSFLSNFDPKTVVTALTRWLPFGNDKPEAVSSAPAGVMPTRNPPTSTSIATQSSSPSLYRILQAEFAADRGDISTALAIYKRQAFNDNATAVFERGLGLSIANEPVPLSLAFANTWQQEHPEHVPALFYVTHLALKAHDYQTAGTKLAQILEYDPNADLTQILIGIYPSEPQDQAELLATLQKINTRDNPSLLVMKAGLLLQFNKPEQALIEINKALRKNPQSPAFITLKADILQKLGSPNDVIRYITQARQALPENKGLFLYQARYLLNQGKSAEAWQLLNSNPSFLADDEIKLLTALVGVDSQRYTDADSLLKDLINNPNYKNQAYYYLAISAERQLKRPDAIIYYGKVMQTDLVLAARKKQLALLLEAQRYDDALASTIKLREDFDDFVPQSYIMQASILQKINQSGQALAVLNEAQKKLPENTDIMFAKVLLLPDDDYITKRALLQNLMQLAPNNAEYRLEYAQLLVNQKIEADTVKSLLSPLINDAEGGLKARQILAQQALHQKDYHQIIMLLSDNFDIKPDVISGLLLRQAYLELNDTANVTTINSILINQLNYTLDTSETMATPPIPATSTTASTLLKK